MQDWVDTIAPNSDAFVENKRRGKDHRQNLIAIAYLLSGFTEFQLVGQVLHRALAYLIFGKTTIDAVIFLVADVLQAWGYSETKTSKGYLPHALSEALLINRSPRLEDLNDEFLVQLRQSDITTTHKETLYYISRALAHPPRVISMDIWAKLQWAGLDLTKADLSNRIYETPLYPFEMVRAMAIVWLFCGLRRNEFRRLRCGCIRLVAQGASLNDGTGEVTAQKVCWRPGSGCARRYHQPSRTGDNYLTAL